MKKKIEDSLQELATDILNNTSEIDYENLKEKARQLYEQLSVMAYLQSNKDDVSTEDKPHAMPPQPFYEHRKMDAASVQDISKEEELLAEPLIEKIKNIVSQMSDGSLIEEEISEILPPKKVHTSKELEDFAVHYQQLPTFERKEKLEELPKSGIPKSNEDKKEKPLLVKDPSRPKSINEKLHNSLTIGLNDRLAFIKHLFADNAEEYHRVISQLSTLENSAEAKNFIDTLVKPEYNNWKGKDIYVERFYALIEKRFD